MALSARLCNYQRRPSRTQLLGAASFVLVWTCARSTHRAGGNEAHGSPRLDSPALAVLPNELVLAFCFLGIAVLLLSAQARPLNGSTSALSRAVDKSSSAVMSSARLAQAPGAVLNKPQSDQSQSGTQAGKLSTKAHVPSLKKHTPLPRTAVSDAKVRGARCVSSTKRQISPDSRSLCRSHYFTSSKSLK